MTCREKLKIEHPDKVRETACGGCEDCPSRYGYLPDPDWCNYGSTEGIASKCHRCWDREIPGTEETKEEVKMGKERKFYSCTEISQMSDFEKSGLIANLQNDIYIKDKECDELKVKLNAKDAEIHYLRSMYDDVDEKFEELQKDSSQLIRKNVDLERDMIILKDTVSDRESFIEKIKKENTGLCDCIKKRNETIGSLKKENEKLKKEKDDLDHILHSKIEALEGDIKCRKLDLEYKNDQIEDLVKRLDNQRKKIEDLENGDVLPYFIRKVVGDKLKEGPCCWATTAEKRNRIEDPFCKSAPCSEAIEQLEKKVDNIPCIKLKDDYKNKEDYKKFEALMYTNHDVAITKYLADWSNRHQTPYITIAEHMMRKYQALRHAGFDHDTALSFIPMWSDE